MESKYATLKTIYEIVKGETHPLDYACLPYQIIVRQSQAWEITLQQLHELAAEELITIQQPGTTICITATGIKKITGREVIATE